MVTYVWSEFLESVPINNRVINPWILSALFAIFFMEILQMLSIF